jgi:type III secretory pathway component EscS
MPSEHPHRGITMHQLPVAGNFPGLVFAIGTALIFLFAIPALWYVLVAAVVVGLLVAALLQVVHREHPDETARLTLKI